jgi:hypothetical protein
VGDFLIRQLFHKSVDDGVVSWARRAAVALRFGRTGRLGLPGRRGRIRADARDAADMADMADMADSHGKHHVHADTDMQGGYGAQDVEDTLLESMVKWELPNWVIDVRLVGDVEVCRVFFFHFPTMYNELQRCILKHEI